MVITMRVLSNDGNYDSCYCQKKSLCIFLAADGKSGLVRCLCRTVLPFGGTEGASIGGAVGLKVRKRAIATSMFMNLQN